MCFVVLAVLNNMLEIETLIGILSTEIFTKTLITIFVPKRTRHSVSGLEHKHGLELSSPEIAPFN